MRVVAAVALSLIFAATAGAAAQQTRVTIFRPFQNGKVPSWVLCPGDGSPFGTGVVRLALSRALPKSLGNHGSPGEGNPWAVKLAGGRVCTFLTGATFAYHGERVNYGCTVKVFLAGSPDRSQATWTITLGTGSKSKPQRAQILVASW